MFFLKLIKCYVRSFFSLCFLKLCFLNSNGLIVLLRGCSKEDEYRVVLMNGYLLVCSSVVFSGNIIKRTLISIISVS